MAIRTLLVAWIAVAIAAVFGATTTSAPALAFGTNPAPKPCAKYKWGTRKWKKCRRKNNLPTSATEQTEQALTLGYTLAMSGKYKQALKHLRPVETADDPRVLTYIGFSERKLGRVDVAMSYYARALELDPRNVATLSYMGEAYLQKGEIAAAQDSLGQIASLCGMDCAEFKALNAAIVDVTTKS